MGSIKAIKTPDNWEEKNSLDEDVDLEEILPIVYSQLKKMANNLRYRFSSNETLNTTALVHEAYLKLAQADAKWTNTLHFYALAAKAMRQILCNYLRKSGAEKRGGHTLDLDIHELEGFLHFPKDVKEELSSLEIALQKLTLHDTRAAQIVECRFYGGMTIEETAKYLDVSDATVKRSWLASKAWLIAQIKNT